LELERQIEKSAAELARLQKLHYLASSTTIPEFMKEVGIKSFTMDTGESLEVQNKVKAGISAKNKLKAFKWLRDNKHGDIIKNKLVITFDRGEDKLVEQVVKLAEKIKLEPEVTETVHGQTLAAFCREQMEKGKLVQEAKDLLGVFDYDLTKIVKPKLKRRK
jgi:Ca2+-binding EF-hand superfamily protein